MCFSIFLVIFLVSLKTKKKHFRNQDNCHLVTIVLRTIALPKSILASGHASLHLILQNIGILCFVFLQGQKTLILRSKMLGTMNFIYKKLKMSFLESRNVQQLTFRF